MALTPALSRGATAVQAMRAGGGYAGGGLAAFDGVLKKCSFLKKRTKKLLTMTYAAGDSATAD
jgi:hypothetical protein